MPQAVDEAGVIWEVDAQGNPIRAVGRQGQQQGPMPVAPNPWRVQQQQAEQQRQAAAESRAQTDQGMQQEKYARDRMEFDATHNPDGTKKLGPADLKPVPAGNITGVTENIKTIREIDKAIQLLQGHPNATGFGTGRMPILGQNFTDYRDPSGTDTRAAIGGIGGLMYHDISGAAVTASESPRLRQFIPTAEDGQAAALKKLVQLRHSITGDTQTQINTFSPDNGYLQLKLRPEDAGVLTSAAPSATSQDDPGAPPPNMRLDAGVPGRKRPEVYLEEGTLYDANGLQKALQNPNPEQLAAVRGGVFMGPEYIDEAVPELREKGDALIRSGGSYEEWKALVDSYGMDPSGQASTDKGYYAAQKWARDHPEYEGALGSMPTRKKKQDLIARAGQSSAATFLRGLTPLAPFMDEGLGAVSSVANGTSYADETAKANRALDLQDQLHPDAKMLGTVVGALGGGAAAGKFAPGLIAKLNNGRRVAAAGGVFGAIEGAGQNNENRLLGAGVGGALGAAGGALGYKVGQKLAAPAAEAFLSSRTGQSTLGALGRLRQTRIGGAILPEPLPVGGRLSPMDKALNSANPNLGNVQSNIAEAEGLGLPYSLADADPRLRMMAGSVSRQSPETYATAENYLLPRTLDQNPRAIQAIGEDFVPPVDLNARSGELQGMASSQSRPLYEEAFRSDQSSWTPRIQQYLDDPMSQGALKKGMETQRLESLASGEKFDPTKFSVTGFNDAGEPMLSRVPTLRAVDAIRRGYGEILDDLPRDAAGRLINTSRSRAVGMAKDSLTGELDSLTARTGNRAYSDAREVYGKFKGMQKSLQQGYDDAGKGVMARDMQTRLAGMPPEQLPEYRGGLATGLRDSIAAPTNNINGFSRLMGGVDQPAKMAAAFPGGFPRMQMRFGHERDMAATAAEVLGNSRTALRQGMDEAVKGQLAMAAELAGQGSTGVPGGGVLAQKALGLLARNRAESAARKNAERLAPILFNDTKAIGAQGLIEELLRKNTARKGRADAYGKLGGLFGVTALNGARQ